MKILVAIIGQSNEAGSAESGRQERTGGIGAPLRDPIAPNGLAGSWWPRLSGLVGTRGVWMDVHNSAVGGTSLCDSWVGRARAYASGMVVGHGGYVLDAGHLYRANGSAGAVYTITTAPSGGVGSSGLTSWVDIGAAGAGDTDGAVYDYGSDRFDPLDYLSGIVTTLNARVGYDAKVVIISIGQGDKTVGSTQAQYSAALIAAADYLTAQGYVVLIGMTCYGATSGLDAWYTSHLLPGRLDALAALDDNQRVKAGANLRAELGVLEVDPSSGPGLQADELHLNHAALMLAADAWDAALAAAGY